MLSNSLCLFGSLDIKLEFWLICFKMPLLGVWYAKIEILWPLRSPDLTNTDLFLWNILNPIFIIMFNQKPYKGIIRRKYTIFRLKFYVVYCETLFPEPKNMYLYLTNTIFRKIFVCKSNYYKQLLIEIKINIFIHFSILGFFF